MEVKVLLDWRLKVKSTANTANAADTANTANHEKVSQSIKIWPLLSFPFTKAQGYKNNWP
jgi:hypothetical protein